MIKSETYHEDNMRVMARYPDGYFDIAIIDPPYGILAPNMTMGSNKSRKGDGYPGVSVAEKLRKVRKIHGAGKLKNRNINKMNIDWDDAPPSPEFFKELFRVSKNQIIFGGNYFDLPPTRCIICWDKKQPWDNFSQWEMAWTSFDKPAKLYRISNKGGNNKEEKIHPTQKPVQLYDNIYRDFVQPGMKVLDTHLGSGSNRITAYKYGCYFVGCETDPIYYREEKKRFGDYLMREGVSIFNVNQI